jgi:hypothetical protein
MRSKTRKTIDRDVWDASLLRLPPPENVKVTARRSRELQTKVLAVDEEVYQFLFDLLGKDCLRTKKEKVAAETQEQRVARRRERDRNWRRAKRRACGMVAREIYECNSITKREPWKTFGWCRRTWERHGKPNVAGVSSPIPAPSSTQRHTCVTPPKPHRREASANASRARRTGANGARHFPILRVGEVSGNPSRTRRTARRRHLRVGLGHGTIWDPSRPLRHWHFTGFHRLALVPSKIVYAPDADPPIQVKETREPPVYLDTSDVGEDEQRLFHETLLMSLPWLSANLRSALLKETGISRHRLVRSKAFSLWLEVNKCRRQLRRKRYNARLGKRLGLRIVSKVQGNLYDLAIEEVAAKHGLTPAALRQRFRRYRPSDLCPSR